MVKKRITTTMVKITTLPRTLALTVKCKRRAITVEKLVGLMVMPPAAAPGLMVMPPVPQNICYLGKKRCQAKR